MGKGGVKTFAQNPISNGSWKEFHISTRAYVFSHCLTVLPLDLKTYDTVDHKLQPRPSRTAPSLGSTPECAGFFFGLVYSLMPSK